MQGHATDDFELFSEDSCSIISNFFTQIPRCRISIGTSEITISDFLLGRQIIGASERVSFELENVGIRNPGSPTAKASVLIRTTKNGNELDSAQSTIFTPAVSKLTQVIVNPSSDFTSEVGSYLFTVISHGPVP